MPVAQPVEHLTFNQRVTGSNPVGHTNPMADHLNMKKFLTLIYKSIAYLINHDGIEHAGYMAFMNILSLFPFLVVFVALSGFVGQSAISAEFVSFLTETIPQDLISSLKPRIHEIISGAPQGVLTMSIIGAIWTASSTIEGMRTILNRIYRIKTPPAYIWRRLLSIGQFVVFNIVIVLTMLFLVITPLIHHHLDPLFDFRLYELEKHLKLSGFINLDLVERYCILFASLYSVSVSLFYIIPNTKLTIKQVMPGAFITVIGWFISGHLLSYYYSDLNQINIIYGSLGNIIISMLFFFLINLMLFYGASFNFILGKMRAGEPLPR